VSKKPSGKYYASLLYEYDFAITSAEVKDVVGLDFSMPELYVDSNDGVPEYPRYYRRALVKLAREQRKLSRCTKGGSNYLKQKLKVARSHEHVANRRSDFLHKQSRRITNAYDAVCIEDLNMKGLSQALNFGKSVADNGWGIFTRMLEYKLIEQGKRLVKIDKWFPSSRMCSTPNCGYKNTGLDLSVREWICPICGAVHNRDINAAINIRNEGLRLLAA
jgi:putative transposase